MPKREKRSVIDAVHDSEFKGAEALTPHIIDNVSGGEGRRSSALQACYSLMKANLGAGIFSLPVAFVRSGFIATVVMLILTTLFIYWTSSLLITLGLQYGNGVNYETIVEHHLGKWGRRICSLSGVVLTFGALCVYAVVVADSLPPVLMSFSPWTEKCVLEKTCDYNSVAVFFMDRKIIAVVVALFIIMPLSSIRNSTYISYVSIVGLSCMVGIIAILVVKSNLPSTPKGPLVGSEVITGVKWSGITFVISTVAYANIINQNMFPIFEGLADKSKSNKQWIIRWSLSLCVAIILFYSIAVYVPLNNKINGNVLNIFPEDDIAANVARILFALDIILTSPVVVYVCRSLILNAFCGGTQKASRFALYITTFLLVAASVTVASSFCKFDIAVALTGGLSASVQAFALPQMCYVSHMLKTGTTWKNYKVIISSVSTLVAAFLIVLSIVDLVENAKNYRAEECAFSFV